MYLIRNILDRVILICGVLCGGALQSFIIQYRQNALGHFSEAIANLEKFQQIANNHHNGDLQALIQKYLENPEASIRETGLAIRSIGESAQFWDLAVHALNSGPISQLWGMIEYFHYETILATWYAFQPAFSFSTDALVMAISVGVIMWAIYWLLLNFVLFCAAKKAGKA